VSEVDVLAVDVGASTIKFATFSRAGAALSGRVRRSTPYPCTPARLIEVLARRIDSARPQRCGVGFPGEVANGRVVNGANLARPGGATSPVDPELAAMWRGFDLQAAITSATSTPTIVLNDASMAALGCARGTGVELVITLGTGCGMALVKSGRLVAVRDVGDEILVGSETYDALLGERGRAANPERWQSHVVTTIDELAKEFSADVIHLAGGNARRLSPLVFGDLHPRVFIERDDPALIGAWRAVHNS